MAKYSFASNAFGRNQECLPQEWRDPQRPPHQGQDGNLVEAALTSPTAAPKASYWGKPDLLSESELATTIFGFSMV
jgi:hypothetical protein